MAEYDFSKVSLSLSLEEYSRRYIEPAIKKMSRRVRALAWRRRRAKGAIGRASRAPLTRDEIEQAARLLYSSPRRKGNLAQFVQVGDTVNIRKPVHFEISDRPASDKGA